MQIRWRPSASISADDGREPEWLVTNGIGGFASGTVVGIHRRRYHGLLIAALRPPVERRLLWAKNDEWLVDGHTRRPLSANDYGDAIYPDGWRNIHHFQLYPFPTTTYLIAGTMLQRTIFMIDGQNTTVVLYRMLTEPGPELHIDLLVNCRDYHHTTSAASRVAGNGTPFAQQSWSAGTSVTAYDGAPELIIGAGCADASESLRYAEDPTWFYNFHYTIERQRGLDYVEDHFRPGVLRWRPRGSGDMFVVVGHCPLPAELKSPPWADGPAALLHWALLRYDEEVARRASLLQPTGPADDVRPDADRNRLILAADAFVVRRQTTGAATIVAGYPWFTDWGRDAMISLPGLLLKTGRFDLAKEVLLTFAHHRAGGLIPNRFPDDGTNPLYNAADASLWFVWAMWHYYKATGDGETIRTTLLPVAQEIIHHYATGTRHGIGMDGDGLVHASDPGLQLTWMDAKAGDWVVTPREGCPVEINALWYNALRTVASLGKVYSPAGNGDYNRLALAARRAFLRRFVREDGNLHDVIPPNGAVTSPHRSPDDDGAVRSNQIFAASLPYPVLDDDRAKRVVAHVRRSLLTPAGLRTLDAGHVNYIGAYEGDQRARDAAYHQGTVWPWLLGAFVTAHRNTGGGESSASFMASLRAHLENEAGLGHVSEIFTGDSPHEPRGCFAQAWSVAEWLRVWDDGKDEHRVGPGAYAYGSRYSRT